MLRFLTKPLFLLAANALGLYLAERYIPGVSLEPGLANLLTLAVVLTLLNLIVRPILKIVLFPLVLITFGLFNILINALILGLLDYISETIIINGALPLVLASILIGIINTLCQYLLFRK